MPFKVNTKAIQTLAKALKAKVNPKKIPDPRTFQQIAQIARSAVIDNIRNKKRNAEDGSRWAPLSKMRKEQKTRLGTIGKGTLVHTGALAKSIRTRKIARPRVSLIEVYSLEPDEKVLSLDKGTPKSRHKTYGKAKSKKGLPARPFLGINPKTTSKIVQRIETRMAELLKQATR